MSINKKLKTSSIQNALITSLLTATSAYAVADVAVDSEKAEQKIEHIVVEGKRPNELKTINVTATKMNVAIKDIGRSITVLDESELEVRGIEDVKEAFKYVAGFRGNGPADRTFTARGLRTSLDNVMVDGLRSMQGGEGGSGSRLPTTFNAESVTFLRGPEALLYGSGIAGGIVNITSKKPSADQSTSLKIKNKSYVSDDTGNFKRNNISFAIDSTGTLVGENLLYRAIAEHTPDGEHFQKGRSLEETLIDFSLTSTHIENTEITARIEYTDRFRTGGSSYADGVFEDKIFQGEGTTYGTPTNRGYYYGSPIDNGANESKSFSLFAVHNINDNWTLTGKFRDSETESNALDLYISDSRGLGNEIGRDNVDRKWVTSFGNDNYSLFDISLEGKAELLGFEHHVLLGTNYRDLDGKTIRSFQQNSEAIGKNNISAANPSQQLIGPIPLAAFASAAPRMFSQLDTNIYLKDRIKVSNSTTVILGLAYVEQEQTQVRSGDTFNNTVNDTLWDFGVVQAINDDINIFATYSRAYQPISARTLANNAIPGKKYVPIEGNNYEFGIKADSLDGDLSSALTLFSIDRSNSTRTETVDDENLLFQFSGKSFESQGVEIDTTYYFSDALSSSVSYAYTRAHDILGDDAGEQESNTPKHSFAVWNSYKHNDKWSYGLGIRYESERNDLSTRNPDLLIEEYVEIDAGAYYVLNNWEVSFVLSNALDKNRAEAGANWVTVLPNEPRSLDVSLRYTFD